MAEVTAQQLKEQRKEFDKEKKRLEEVECHLNAQKLQLEQKRKDLTKKDQDVRNPAARRKSLQRVKQVMPRQAAQNANTTMDLINNASPRKAAAMKERNMHTSTEKRMESALHEVVAIGLSKPKYSSARISLVGYMHILKKYKLLRKTANKFAVSRKLLSQAKKYTAGRNSLPPSTVQAVQEIYESISNCLPDKKDGQ